MPLLLILTDVFQGLGDFSVHYVELDMDGITVVQPTDT